MLSACGGEITDVIEAGVNELFVSTLNRGFFRVKLRPESAEIFNSPSDCSLSGAKGAPQISESDALTKLDGEPAFLSKEGIARYEVAANRFVSITALEPLFRDYFPSKAIV